MRGEIGRLLRPPVMRDIVGRRADHPVELGDPFRDHRRLAEWRKAKRDVEAALREVVLAEPGILQ